MEVEAQTYHGLSQVEILLDTFHNLIREVIDRCIKDPGFFYNVFVTDKFIPTKVSPQVSLI
jgi:hypothetical protein